MTPAHRHRHQHHLLLTEIHFHNSKHHQWQASKTELLKCLLFENQFANCFRGDRSVGMTSESSFNICWRCSLQLISVCLGRHNFLWIFY